MPRPTDAELAALRRTMSIAEIAHRFEVSTSTVQRWIVEAALRGMETGPQRPTEVHDTKDVHAVRKLLLARATAVAVDTNIHDDRARIAQARFAFDMYMALGDVQHARGREEQPIDRKSLYERVRKATDSAERTLRIVKTG